jgi:hypothetical protein
LKVIMKQHSIMHKALFHEQINAYFERNLYLI